MDNTNKFLVDMMRFASMEESPDNIISLILEYICRDFKADRAYIFEDTGDGFFRNTYEACSDSAESFINCIQNVHFDNMMELWYKQFELQQNVIIENLEDYRHISEEWYEILKEQNVNTLVSGPIFNGGKITGIYGVDNPPADILEGISAKIDVMRFIIEMMIRLRNNVRVIESASKTDFLTKCNNRAALDWAYENDYQNASSIGIIMFDVNGLKKINDSLGHKAGDAIICTTADMLKECFDRKNVYRLGGDEFAVVILSESREETEKRISRFLDLRTERQIDISYGFEYCDSKDNNFEKLLHKADTRMYEAKTKYYQSNS